MGLVFATIFEKMLRVQMRGALGTNTVPGRGNPDPVLPEHVGFRHFSASHGPGI
jgi:hypothetical protein